MENIKAAIEMYGVYTRNIIVDSTKKPRKWVRRHKDGVITGAILVVGSAVVANNIRILSNKVNQVPC